MTRNVTLRIDEELLRDLRHRAVDSDMSLSAWIVSVLQHQVAEEAQCAAARHRALQRLKSGFPLGGQPLGRDESHAR